MPVGALGTTWVWAGEVLPGGCERWVGVRGLPAKGNTKFATLRANPLRTAFAVTNEQNGHRHSLHLLAGGGATCTCEARGSCWHRSLVLCAGEHRPEKRPSRRCLYCGVELPAWVSAEWPICPRCRDIAAAEDARALEVTP